MRIKLVSHSPFDGVGLIRTEDGVRLVRPPYASADSPRLSEESIGESILKYEFFATDREFETFEQLINFLNEVAADSRKKIGREIPESFGSEILDCAPTDILSSFLDRVKDELIAL